MEKHEYKCDGETTMCDRCGGAKEDNVHQMEKSAGEQLVEFIRYEIIKQYMAFNKPIRGHTWGYWQNKLKEENPEYTDDDASAVIGSWEEEEKMKKQETREANGTDKNIDKDLNNDKKEDITETLKSIKTKNDLILMLRI